MKKSHINPMPLYFDRYINLYGNVEMDQAFQASLDEIATFDWASCQKLGHQTYAPGKWTVADILQHLIDWERIMGYRALVFAREALKKTQGMDEDLLAAKAGANARSIPDLVVEMTALRNSTRIFYNYLSDEQLLRSGICWRSQMPVLAFGFTIVGHQRHHFNIIKERYLSLI
ncbi:MAG: DinB family protein [Saprospiraceae bacterium]